MDRNEILRMCDHTQLKQVATWQDIVKLCDEAVECKTASVCIPPCFVSMAKNRLNGTGVKVCTVIGFPNGYQTTATKVFETKDAIENGADEIDMVININMLKYRRDEYIVHEISAIKRECKEHILKVIIETCFLTEEEIIAACDLVSRGGADFIKTSTGFGPEGATVENVKLMKEHVQPQVKIKAAGGISNFEEARQMIEAGAERIGTSRLAKKN